MDRLSKEILKDRPFSYIPLGDDAGFDLSRNGRHATVTASQKKTGGFGSSQRGRATSFGQTASASVSNANLTPAAGATSYGVWIKSTQTAGAGVSSTQVIFSRTSALFNYLNRPASGKWTSYWGAGSEAQALVSSGQVLANDGRWHQWYWVRDTGTSPATLRIYVDGYQDSSRAEAGTAPGGTNLLRMECPTGFTDDVHFAHFANYGYALSPARIRAQYLAGIGRLNRKTRRR